MKRNIFPLMAITLIICSAFTVKFAQEWKISDNYSIRFNGGDPSGEFKGLMGSLRFDPNDLAGSKFDVSVEVASINTGNGMKNTHAKSAMWFDAEKYPLIKFSSSSITKTTSGFETRGIMEMHGVQKEVVIPFAFEDNTFKGSFEVNRMDYKINVAEPDHGASKFKLEISVPVTK
ncbi:YceI family protein [Flavihumibacter fluvii]|uniref:YceI family protein n=1 Tax=Flavihumibacter fluvii TaxID=2838157 RepID=UPI001BDE48D7|nr:YceI family protein [Flavihumibacter fluvii]ULQ53606.1 YceI family protein [Flavihumibacter fluvii]